MARRHLLLPALSLLLACGESADTGDLDAGAAPDATVVVTDGGAEPDAGVEEDAGVEPDAGPEVDAGGGGEDLQVVFRVTVPANTPDDGPVHIAGDFQGWDPSDPTYALTPAGGQTHEITLTFAPGTRLAFKFARGDWDRVEKGSSGEEIMDRQLVVTEAGVQTFTVQSWADGSPLPSTITGTVETIQVPGFLDGRRVWVYLPPDYATTRVAYPVLYMLDGQNVFDQRTSFSGEWGVDETLERLIPSGEVAPLIVVAVDNGGAARLEEYTPWAGERDGQVVGGGGQAHLQAFVDVLKPWIDANYRTRPDAANTGLSGSSLGGLMSVYGAYAHGDTFGRVGALSPSIWWSNRRLVEFARAQTPATGVRLWVDMGTRESGVEALEALQVVLLDDGFVEGRNLSVVIAQGAGHNEAAWRGRMPDVLRFLFPGGN